jgi:intracellular multiplication protein IcmX
MKIQTKLATTTTLLTAFIMPFVSYANSTGESSDVATYLYNLGMYMGIDLATAPTPGTVVSSTATSDITDITNAQYSAGISYVAAFPFMIDLSGDKVSKNLSYVPDSLSAYSIPYDILTNTPTFTSSVWKDFVNVDTDDPMSALKATPVYGIDQEKTSAPTFYSSITSQAIYDLLTTPNYTYCTEDYTETTGIYRSDNANCLGLKGLDPIPFHSFEVTNNIMNGGETEITDATSTNILYGTNLPSPTTAVSAEYNTPLVPQLDVNTLIGPLMYNTNANTTTSDETGYPATTQETQAMSFVNYLSGKNLISVSPTYYDYNNLYNQIIGSTSTVTDEDRHKALTTVYKYFMNLRTYAATMSVGLSNLSDIMARRMPNGITKTSQAFDEYTMATRRIITNNDSTDSTSGSTSTENKWLTDMEKAPSVVIQREMLYLLSEINYQMYLDRQQNEKILLTLTAMQLQIANTSRTGISMQEQ